MQWMVGGGLLTAGALFLHVYGPYVVPHVTTTLPEPTLRVMTFNILITNVHTRAVCDVVLRHRPDVVCFQEVTERHADGLVGGLSAAYPHHRVSVASNGVSTAVFSRMAPSESFDVHLGTGQYAAAMSYERNGRRLTVLSAHLHAYMLWLSQSRAEWPARIRQRTAMQNAQARILADRINGLAGDVVLGADANCTEGSRTHRILTGVMQDSARVAGWRPFAAKPPGLRGERRLRRWDYVFFRGDLRPVATYIVEDRAGSDHFAVFADFE